MFNKNNIINKVELNNYEFYKQYNDILITPFFVIMLNKYYEEKSIEEHLDFDNNIKLYNNKKIEYRAKKHYSDIITNLYKNGKIILNNQKYSLRDFYIVYHNNDFNLISTDKAYHNKECNYDHAVKLIDTTVFIELIEKGQLEENTIIIDENDLLNIIKNWNGLLHDKTFETDAIKNKEMLGNDQNE